jgi:predicted nucleotidyltransferase
MADQAMMVGSGALQRLILQFVLFPDVSPHFRELQRLVGGGVRSLRAALQRLEGRRLVTSSGSGNRRHVQVNASHPGWDALRRMVRVFVAPEEVLRAAVAGVPGIRAAFVFGSVARGEARPESDVDFFVVGDEIPRRALARSVSESSAVLGREVNVVRYTGGELERSVAEKRGFIREVAAAPKRWVVGDESALPELFA